MTSPSEVDALLAHVDAYATELGTHWEGCEANHPRCLLHKLAQIVREQRDITDAAQARIAELYELLGESGMELARCKIFVGSREKMHPDGLTLYQELLDRIDAAMEKEKKIGVEK